MVPVCRILLSFNPTLVQFKRHSFTLISIPLWAFNPTLVQFKPDEIISVPKKPKRLSILPQSNSNSFICISMTHTCTLSILPQSNSNRLRIQRMSMLLQLSILPQSNSNIAEVEVRHIAIRLSILPQSNSNGQVERRGDSIHLFQSYLSPIQTHF